MSQRILVVVNPNALAHCRAILPAACRVVAAFDPLTGVYADRVLVLRSWNAWADARRLREAATVWLESQVRSSCPDDTVLEWFATLPEVIDAALAACEEPVDAVA